MNQKLIHIKQQLQTLLPKEIFTLHENYISVQTKNNYLFIYENLLIEHPMPPYTYTANSIQQLANNINNIKTTYNY